MLLEREELEYALEEDAEKYKARVPCRFVAPEIVAVLGDVRRRLALLRGTRLALQRHGFSKDLKTIANATVEDYETALGIAGPRESIIGALGHKELPASVKTALRTLLLSTSDVPGTEGHKVAMRHNGHANNLFFGAASYFCTPNFADNYSPLMKILHDGPDSRDHLRSLRPEAPQESEGAAEPLASARPPFMLRAEPTMPTLEKMHQLTAANPRAQAKFFLLKVELHNRFLLGIEKMHIGRRILASFRTPGVSERSSPAQLIA